MRLPAGGAVTGWAACRLHGGNFFDGLGTDGTTHLRVPLNVGPRGNIRAADGVQVCFHQLGEADRAVRHGIPTVTAVRAAYDAVRLADDPRQAVVAIDMMAAAEIVSIRMLREYAGQHQRDRGLAQVLDLASEHARSPNEVRLRLVWEIDAKLPHPLVNCPIHDRGGRLLGIADLLDVEAGLVVEFDGADHRRARRQTKDVQKEDRLRRNGLEVTRVTGLELPDRDAVVQRLLAARRRAVFQAPQDRGWVARPPADDLHQRIIERQQIDRMHEAMEAQPLPDITELRGY